MKKLFLLLIPLLFISCDFNKENNEPQQPSTAQPTTQQPATTQPTTQQPSTDQPATPPTEQPTTSPGETTTPVTNPTTPSTDPETPPEEPEIDTRIPADTYTVIFDFIGESQLDQQLLNFDYEISDNIHFGFKYGYFHKNQSTGEKYLVLDNLTNKNNLNENSNHFSITNLPVDDHSRKISFCYKTSNNHSNVILKDLNNNSYDLNNDTNWNWAQYTYAPGTTDFTFYPLIDVENGGSSNIKIYIRDITIQRIN